MPSPEPSGGNGGLPYGAASQPIDDSLKVKVMEGRLRVRSTRHLGAVCGRQASNYSRRQPLGSSPLGQDCNLAPSAVALTFADETAMKSRIGFYDSTGLCCRQSFRDKFLQSFWFSQQLARPSDDLVIRQSLTSRVSLVVLGPVRQDLKASGVAGAGLRSYYRGGRDSAGENVLSNIHSCTPVWMIGYSHGPARGPRRYSLLLQQPAMRIASVVGQILHWLPQETAERGLGEPGGV